jgi:hypothetical protein
MTIREHLKESIKIQREYPNKCSFSEIKKSWPLRESVKKVKK